MLTESVATADPELLYEIDPVATADELAVREAVALLDVVE